MATTIVPGFGFLSSKVSQLLNLTRIAKKRSLYFSNHDELGTNAIAMDTTKRRLYYLQKVAKLTSCLVIDLRNVNSCSITKQYSSIDVDDLKTKKLHHFLKSIFLNFRFKNRTDVVSLPLYDASKNRQGDLSQLEEKAQKWQVMVSKLLHNPINVIA